MVGASNRLRNAFLAGAVLFSAGIVVGGFEPWAGLPLASTGGALLITVWALLRRQPQRRH